MNTAIIDKILDKIRQLEPFFFDPEGYSAGPDEWICPLCTNRRTAKWYQGVLEEGTMDSIDHDDDCPYLLQQQVHGTEYWEELTEPQRKILNDLRETYSREIDRLLTSLDDDIRQFLRGWHLRTGDMSLDLMRNEEGEDL